MTNTEEDQTAVSDLTPFKTPRSNAVLKGPAPDVGDLDCELSEDTSGQIVTVSAWAPDENQRAMIEAGAHLRMSVWQHPIPPLALAIEAPFCPNCGSGMVWVRGERVFACACDGETTTIRGKPEEVGGDADEMRARRAEEAVRADFIPATDAAPDADERPDG